MKQMEKDVTALSQGMHKQYCRTVIPGRLRPDFVDLRRHAARLKRDVAKIKKTPAEADRSELSAPEPAPEGESE